MRAISVLIKMEFQAVYVQSFLDVTNWYVAKSPAFPQYTFQRNQTNTAFLTRDGQSLQLNGSNAIPFILSNDEGTPIPTIGFIVEF